MRNFLTFLSVMVSLSSMGDNAKLVKLRELYYKASQDKTFTQAFSVAAEKSTGVGETLLTGYQGMLWMIRANQAFNPYNKLSYFFKGKNLLEKAISKDPENIELRFLRFCIQTNAPGFLRYDSDVKSDRSVLINSYQTLNDTDLKKRIRDYMLEKGDCNSDEKTRFL